MDRVKHDNDARFTISGVWNEAKGNKNPRSWLPCSSTGSLIVAVFLTSSRIANSKESKFYTNKFCSFHFSAILIGSNSKQIHMLVLRSRGLFCLFFLFSGAFAYGLVAHTRNRFDYIESTKRALQITT